MKTASNFPPVRDLVTVFAALILLLIMSAATAALPPAPWKTAFSLAVSAAKTCVIALVFMKLREHRGLMRIFAVAGLFWLAIFGTLILADYLTRA